ncbi:MAG: hypothetical protein EPGJADBJ_03967 [Saprospiraceae bacterium]|nr:hypothetical protein [Saprospiraceae bacterium]
MLVLLHTLPAQTLPDTIGIHKKFRFTYQGETIKRAKPLGNILMKEPVEPQVRLEWNKYKTMHGIGLGAEVLGLGVMTAGLVKELNGESNSLTLPGAIILLGGVLIDGFVAIPHAKSAARHYNNAKMGRNLPVDPPMPVVFTSPQDSLPTPVGATIEKKQKKAVSTGAYYGFAAGLGWSKQKINYEYTFAEDYESARVFSFGLQYGKSISDNWGWQIELGLTQHGYRLKTTEYDYNTGLKVEAKADARIRYLEIPFSMTYRIPLNDNGLELLAMPGLNVGYALSGKIVAKGSGENETRTVETKITEKISLEDTEFGERLDAALLLGAQMAYPFGPGKAFLEARYHLGILNLDRGADSDTKTFNRSLLLRVGYRHAL